uniref:Uncharacterized protein n=1 Tax=Trichobilharzia regenti TaxID=157069 RepID=A0AA85IQS7_TRIRE|nr:unnamed protein product [Trichobilharzia regenti]
MQEINFQDISLECGSTCTTSASVISALGSQNRKLFVGSSSVSGDLWVGGLSVYKLKNSSTNYLGQVIHADELELVDDISQQVVTETTFDSSVASVSPLNSKGNESTDSVIVGLNDGSIQLVTLREKSVNQSSHHFQMQPVTVNSATYHDWPLEKVITSQISDSSNSHIVTLDISGCVKLWDYQFLMPVKSWFINSTTWPVNGSALSPDISMLSNTNSIQNNSENFLLATLNPLDYKRKICLWDIRINSISNPIVFQSNNCSSLPHNDLPTTLNWFSTNQLLVGTYEGSLLMYDIRNPNFELISVNVYQSNGGNTPETLESFKPPRNKHKQIVQILVNNSPPIISGKSKTDHNSEQHIGVVHIDGTVDVYQYNTVLSNQNTTLTRAYHSGDDDVGEHYSNSQKESVFNRNGRVKPCAVFLSSSSSDHSWRLLASSGLSDISSSPQSSASASLSVESHNTRHLLNYQLRVYPGIRMMKAPGFNDNSLLIHYLKYMTAI